MLKLHGFSASNYYGKVKLALLEKGIPFEEVLVWPFGDEGVLAHSPLGKIPYLETGHGCLCESQVLVEYIEAAYPQPALMPADPFLAAKQKEIITFIEWHLEMVARELLPEAVFGGKVSDETKERCKKAFAKNVPAFKRLFKPAPWLGGEQFSLADCAAAVHFPLISLVSQKIYGEDVLAALQAEDYLQRLASRPLVQKVQADARANVVQLLARLQGGH